MANIEKLDTSLLNHLTTEIIILDSSLNLLWLNDSALANGWAPLGRVAWSRLDPCTGSGTVLFGSGLLPRWSGACPALVSRLTACGQVACMP